MADQGSALRAGSFHQQVSETATALGISERDALTLELLASSAWAHVNRKPKLEAEMFIAAKHAAGQMDGATMHQCFIANGAAA